MFPTIAMLALCTAQFADGAPVLKDETPPAASALNGSNAEFVPDDEEQTVNATAAGNWNVATNTLGGRQFWGDVAWFRGWRIQQHVLSGHYRLLDPKDVRKAWGSHQACRDTLRNIRESQKLQPLSGRVVILIHGITRSSKSFAAMKSAFEENGVPAIGFDYPSTRVSIADSSEYLHRLIESLEGVEKIDLVVHSMGGLVTRAYLAKHQDPRINRLVMLGVPNLGARMANLLKDVSVFKWVMGPAGQQLIEDDAGFINGLPTPTFPFAVIAGERGTPDGYNPLIPGDDDGTISVSTTRLPGAADFMTVRSLHSFLMGNADVIAATQRFLNGGSLRESGEFEPISVVAAPPAPLTAGDRSPSLTVPGQ
jgi:pimeloyl-ACP methyl ester carboxylesterase